MLAPKIGSAVSMRNSVVKALAGNLTIFPAYVAAFFTYMGVLEGRDPSGIGSKVQQSFTPTYKSGFSFWIVANFFNFQYVQPSSRVYYVSLCGLVWNAYLSWANQQYSRAELEESNPAASNESRKRKPE